MRARFFELFLLTFCLTTGLSAVEPTWPHEASDIVVDPAVRFGILENGFRYAILPNKEPPGRVSLRLHVGAGSLDEEEDQRGIAHFLEHMVFNGSRNFPDVETLIPEMQRLGIAFGAHANAYTSFDETVYMLDLPNTEAETLDLTFTVMRDFADGALLDPEEIEKERGVIMAELQSRDSVQMRLMEQELNFLLPDFLVSQRLPIGLESVIENATAERFVDFYRTHYIPQNICFVVVGDIDPDAIEARIREVFSGIEKSDTPYASPDLGEIPTGFGFRAAVFTDNEVSSDSISLSSMTEDGYEPDTVENRIKKMPIQTAYAILNRRLAILSKEEGSPLKGGSAYHYEWLNALENHTISASPEEGKWPEATAMIEQELRRALEHGFTQAEVDEIRAKQLNALEEAATRAPTRKSPGLASELVGSLNDGHVFNHPEESLRIYELAAPTITAASAHAALKEAWADADLNLTLTTKSADPDTAAQLETAFIASRSVEVAPPEETEQVAFAYTDFGPPGEILERKDIEDLEFVQLKLSNNVRVNLKETDFQKNSILMTARFGSGQLSQPKDKTGLDMLTSALLNGGGLGAHSNDELQRILAGKNFGVGFSINEDSFTLSGSTTPEDFELQLQLMVARLTDPGYRDEALRQFRKQLPALESNLKHTLSGAAADMQEWLKGGDGRFAKVDPEVLASYTAQEVREWMAEEMETGYLELSIVGDFEIEIAIPLILKTFGSLPERANAKPELSDCRHIETPAMPAEKTFFYDSKIDKALALVSWAVEPINEDMKEARRMNVLASIVGDRLRKEVREELGASYSPNASYSASEVYNTGSFSVSSLGTHKTAPELQDLMQTIAETLADEGIQDDEFQRAHKPILNQLELSRRQNTHWLNVILGRSQEKPVTLDWARNRDSDFASITAEEVDALAKKYLRSDRSARITLIPNNSAELNAKEWVGRLANTQL